MEQARECSIPKPPTDFQRNNNCMISILSIPFITNKIYMKAMEVT